MNDVANVVPSSLDDPRVRPVAQEVGTVAEQAECFEVTTAEQFEAGAELLKTIKGLSKTVEDRRKKITVPLDQAKRGVMELFRPLTDSLSSAEGKLKRRLVTWQNEQDRIAREQARAAEEKARREREKLEREAAAAEAKGRAARADTLRERAVSTVATTPETHVPKVSGLSSRTTWKFRIVDASKVPDKYKILDEKKIGGVVRALKGDTDIPGIEVYEEKGLAAGAA